MKYNKLTSEEEKVIIHKGTELPFSGEYCNSTKKGIYTCKQCEAKLYKSEDKFDSRCGWPSFDDQISNAIKRILDADGIRTEIVCNNCDAHLGHIFEGEQLTKKNIRHCVNSISMNFISEETSSYSKAYFAGGCFWGVEYFFQKATGVISTSVGYMGGTTKNPSYEHVCNDNLGHIETIEVIFDDTKTTYKDLAILFFEIHDPTQINKQGPDVGEQYKSVVFYMNNFQKKTVEKLIEILKMKGLNVFTELRKASQYWRAEEYHQDYYRKNGNNPYCHFYLKKF